jgi:hypothetical protein
LDQAAKFCLCLILVAIIVYFVLLKNLKKIGVTDILLVLRFTETIIWMIPPALAIILLIN